MLYYTAWITWTLPLGISHDKGPMYTSASMVSANMVSVAPALAPAGKVPEAPHGGDSGRGLPAGGVDGLSGDVRCGAKVSSSTANLCTKILDFGGFDSSRI